MMLSWLSYMLVIFFITYCLIVVGLLSKIIKTLNAIWRLLKPDNKLKYIEFYSIINGHLEKVVKMDLRVGSTQMVMVVGKDAKGNVVPLVEIPVWGVLNPELLGVEVQVDPTEAYLVPVGPVGQTQVQATVGTIVGTLDINLIPGVLATLEIVPVA